MPGWDAALDAMNDLRRSYSTDEGAYYLAGWFLDWADKRGISQQAIEAYATGIRGTLEVAAIEAYATGIRGTLEVADPVWVSEEIVELIEGAAKSFRPEPVFLDDLIVPAGFALLERPLELIDRKGAMLKYRAIQWAQMQIRDNGRADGRLEGEGVMVALYAHADDDGSNPYAFANQRMIVGGSLLSLDHVFPLTYGEDYATMPDEEDPVNVESWTTMLAQVQTLWRLAKQEIVLSSLERASRGAWRRTSNWRQIKHVTVMKLRRAGGKRYEGEGSEREWSHRWLVRGHWRNQWYPVLKAHRQIWITPYVKGPEDRPFVAKDRAIEFYR